MKVIVDANVVIAALAKPSITREVLLYPYINYYSPDFLLTELKEHENEIIEKVKVGYKAALKLLIANIIIMPFAFYRPSLKEAQNIIGNIDMDDEPYTALALSLKVDGIWSYDSHFKKQNSVDILSTSDLLSAIRSGLV
jgi:predicted nucleic acid-binding protein